MSERRITPHHQAASAAAELVLGHACILKSVKFKITVNTGDELPYLDISFPNRDRRARTVLELLGASAAAATRKARLP